MRIFAVVAISLIILVWIFANLPNSFVDSKPVGAYRGDSIESAKPQIPERKPATSFHPEQHADTALIVFPDGIAIEVKLWHRPREAHLRSGWELGNYEKFADRAERGDGEAAFLAIMENNQLSIMYTTIHKLPRKTKS